MMMNNCQDDKELHLKSKEIHLQRMETCHMESVMKLVLDAYRQACLAVPELPSESSTGILEGVEAGIEAGVEEGIQAMIHQNGGIVAIIDGEVMGFMTGMGPFDEHFGRVKGIYTPLHGHGTSVSLDGGIREKVYDLMYQATSEMWMTKGILSHAITVYSHEERVRNVFFMNGFGMRCMDAVKKLSANQWHDDYSALMNGIGLEYDELSELDGNDLEGIVTLKNGLIEHLKSSPVYMPLGFQYTVEAARAENTRRKSTYYGIRSSGKVVAFMEVMDSGENFIGDHPGFFHICGAFMVPELRGENIFGRLLSYVEQQVAEGGGTHLGVDFESFNPTARRFWLKHFKAYTHSLVRRIDERILAIENY